ncbi:FecR family protein, partial [Pseudomonas aeruginosa]
MSPPSQRNAQVPLDDALERHRDVLKDLFPLPLSRPQSRKASMPAGVALFLALAIGALAWLDPAYKRERFATSIGE